MELPKIRVSAGPGIGITVPGNRAPGKNCRRRAADETPGLADNFAPQRWIERRVIDLADELREILCLIRSHHR
jgi:hypothetical protein